ncbi:hypothetical protein CR513_43254, partial [Mucuna pruriens]
MGKRWCPAVTPAGRGHVGERNSEKGRRTQRHSHCGGHAAGNREGRREERKRRKKNGKEEVFESAITEYIKGKVLRKNFLKYVNVTGFAPESELHDGCHSFILPIVIYNGVVRCHCAVMENTLLHIEDKENNYTTCKIWCVPKVPIWLSNVHVQTLQGSRKM